MSNTGNLFPKNDTDTTPDTNKTDTGNFFNADTTVGPPSILPGDPPGVGNDGSLILRVFKWVAHLDVPTTPVGITFDYNNASGDLIEVLSNLTDGWLILLNRGYQANKDLWVSEYKFIPAIDSNTNFTVPFTTPIKYGDVIDTSTASTVGITLSNLLGKGSSNQLLKINASADNIVGIDESALTVSYTNVTDKPAIITPAPWAQISNTDAIPASKLTNASDATTLDGSTKTQILSSAAASAAAADTFVSNVVLPANSNILNILRNDTVDKTVDLSRYSKGDLTIPSDTAVPTLDTDIASKEYVDDNTAPVATDTTDGLMSKEDKEYLDNRVRDFVGDVDTIDGTPTATPSLTFAVIESVGSANELLINIPSTTGHTVGDKVFLYNSVIDTQWEGTITSIETDPIGLGIVFSSAQITEINTVPGGDDDTGFERWFATAGFSLLYAPSIKTIGDKEVIQTDGTKTLIESTEELITEDKVVALLAPETNTSHPILGHSTTAQLESGNLVYDSTVFETAGETGGINQGSVSIIDGVINFRTDLQARLGNRGINAVKISGTEYVVDSISEVWDRDTNTVHTATLADTSVNASNVVLVFGFNRRNPFSTPLSFTGALEDNSITISGKTTVADINALASFNTRLYGYAYQFNRGLVDGGVFSILRYTETPTHVVAELFFTKDGAFSNLRDQVIATATADKLFEIGVDVVSEDTGDNRGTFIEDGVIGTVSFGLSIRTMHFVFKRKNTTDNFATQFGTGTKSIQFVKAETTNADIVQTTAKADAADLRSKHNTTLIGVLDVSTETNKNDIVDLDLLTQQNKNTIANDEDALVLRNNTFLISLFDLFAPKMWKIGTLKLSGTTTPSNLPDGTTNDDDLVVATKSINADTTGYYGTDTTNQIVKRSGWTTTAGVGYRYYYKAATHNNLPEEPTTANIIQKRSKPSGGSWGVIA